VKSSDPLGGLGVEREKGQRSVTCHDGSRPGQARGGCGLRARDDPQRSRRDSGGGPLSIVAVRSGRNACPPSPGPRSRASRGPAGGQDRAYDEGTIRARSTQAHTGHESLTDAGVLLPRRTGTFSGAASAAKPNGPRDRSMTRSVPIVEPPPERETTRTTADSVFCGVPDGSALVVASLHHSAIKLPSARTHHLCEHHRTVFARRGVVRSADRRAGRRLVGSGQPTDPTREEGGTRGFMINQRDGASIPSAPSRCPILLVHVGR